MPATTRKRAHRLDTLAPTAALLLVLAAASPVVAGSGLAADCLKLTAPITLDGSAADWQGVPFSYVETSVHVLALAHDDTTLYVMFRFADDRLAREILHRGVVLWLDSGSSHDTVLGVRYAGSKGLAKTLAAASAAPDGDTPPSEAPSGWEDRPARPPHPSLRHLEPGSIAVLGGHETQTRVEDLPGGPRAASALNEGVYAYEFAIPLSMLGESFARGAGAKGLTFQLGVQVGGMTKAERKAMREASAAAAASPAASVTAAAAAALPEAAPRAEVVALAAVVLPKAAPATRSPGSTSPCADGHGSTSTPTAPSARTPDPSQWFDPRLKRNAKTQRRKGDRGRF